jgi:hypothetical protein
MSYQPVFCITCGMPNTPETQYCPGCGASIAQPPPVNPNSSNSKFGRWWATQSPNKRLGYYGVIFILLLGFLSVLNRIPEQRHPKSPEIKITTVPSNTPPPVAVPLADMSSSKRISKQELGKDYPLTVSEGYVSCKSGAVFFSTGGQTYAVNGTAKSLTPHKPIDEIWADDPDIKGAKMDISKVIQIGLELCR